MVIASSTMWTESGSDRAPGKPSPFKTRQRGNRYLKCKVYMHMNQNDVLLNLMHSHELIKSFII
jgi:hypothetical protein